MVQIPFSESDGAISHACAVTSSTFQSWNVKRAPVLALTTIYLATRRQSLCLLSTAPHKTGRTVCGPRPNVFRLVTQVADKFRTESSTAIRLGHNPVGTFSRLLQQNPPFGGKSRTSNHALSSWPVRLGCWFCELISPLSDTGPLSGYKHFRMDAPLSAKRRKEATESNANMGVFMTTKEFIGTFFCFPPPQSCPTKPPLMSNDIANEVRKAAARPHHERRIAELWVRI